MLGLKCQSFGFTKNGSFYPYFSHYIKTAAELCFQISNAFNASIFFSQQKKDDQHLVINKTEVQWDVMDPDSMCYLKFPVNLISGITPSQRNTGRLPMPKTRAQWDGHLVKALT